MEITELFNGPPLAEYLAGQLKIGVSSFHEADLRRCEDYEAWARMQAELLLPDAPLIRWDRGFTTSPTNLPGETDPKGGYINRVMPETGMATYIIPLEKVVHPDDEGLGYGTDLVPEGHMFDLVPREISPLLTYSTLPRFVPCPVDAQLSPHGIVLRVRQLEDINQARTWIEERLSAAIGMVNEMRPIFHAWTSREAYIRILELNHTANLAKELTGIQKEL